MVFLELWEWIGEYAPQLGIVIAGGLPLLIYLHLKQDKNTAIREELEDHRKELLELQASTLEFTSLSDDVIRGHSNLTDYRPKIRLLTYDNEQHRETIALLNNLQQRCADQFSIHVGGETGDEMRIYAKKTIGEIDKVIGHINSKLW